MIYDFTVFAISHFIGTIGPGLCTFFVMQHAIIGGRRHGFLAANGVATYDSIHGAMALFGASSLFCLYPQSERIIQIFSGLYLLLIAAYIAKSSLGPNFTLKSADEEISSTKKRLIRNSYFITGVVISMLNIKLLIFYVAIFSEFAGKMQPYHKIFCMLWIIAVNFLCYYIIAYVSASSYLRQRLIRKLSLIKVIFSFVLVYFAVKLFIEN